MSDENTNVGALPPDPAALQAMVEELSARLAKYESDNVVRPKFAGEVPKYRLNEPVYLEDDTLHDEGEELEYLGTPNLAMVPLNDSARAKMQDYIDFLTDNARRTAEMYGRPFSGWVSDRGTMIAQSMQDMRNTPDRVQMVRMPESKDGYADAMPHTPEAKAHQRRRGRPTKESKVVSAVAPPPPPKQGPVPTAILGRDYNDLAASDTRL